MPRQLLRDRARQKEGYALADIVADEDTGIRYVVVTALTTQVDTILFDV